MEKTIVLDVKLISLFLFIGAFLLTYVFIPTILGVALKKQLVDNPNNRSSHTVQTPTLGGIAFFFTIMVCLFFISVWDIEGVTPAITTGLTIMFVTGLKDDLVSVQPLTKLIAQIVGATFLISQSTLHISTFNGFMGIDVVSSLISYPFNIFIIITIVNAFNLIDGVDGLASIVGSVICLVYGIFFYYMGEYYFFFIGIVMCAILLAFLRYNFSRGDKKIFMGDTGSMITGFVIGILSIRFLATPTYEMSKLLLKVEHAPLIVLSILIVPVFDTIRVFSIRVLNKKNPFSPDKNHIHHILLNLGMSHKKTSLVMGLFNLAFVFLFLILSNYSKKIPPLFLFFLAIILLIYLFYRIDFRYSNLRLKVRLKKLIFRKK